MDSYCHFRFCRHSWPHLVLLHFIQGKWQPGQSTTRQSQLSIPDCIWIPFSLNIFAFFLFSLDCLDDELQLRFSRFFSRLGFIGSKSTMKLLDMSSLETSFFKTFSVTFALWGRPEFSVVILIFKFSSPLTGELLLLFPSSDLLLRRDDILFSK